MGENGVVIERTSDYIKIRYPSGIEDVHYSVFYKGIPEEFVREARETLNETEENKKNGIRSLRAFAKREDLSCTEEDMLLVLRVSKYNIKKAENKLKNYLKLRQRVRKLVSNMDDSKTDMILDEKLFNIFPYRDRYGRITVTTNANIHLDLYSLDEVDPILLSFALYVCTLPLTMIAGASYIGECKTDDLYLFYPIIKQFKKSYFSLYMELPVRLGRFNLVNENFLVRWCYKIMSPLVPEKLSKRAHFHGNSYEKLKAYYNPELLPEEFGGKLGPFNDKHFRQRLLNFIQKLKEESN